MIIISTQVQDAMYHHAMQFFIKRHLVLLCIVTHAIDADVDLGQDGIVIEREGDDICIIIMTEMSLVDFEEKSIGAKDVVDPLESIAFCINGIADPLRPLISGGEINGYIVTGKEYTGSSFFRFRPK